MAEIICILIYCVLAVLGVLLLLVGSRKYKDLIAPLDPKKNILKELYPVGFQILDMIGYKFESSYDKKRRAQAIIVFGERFGEYYFRVSAAEKATLIFIGVIITPILGPLLGNPILCLGGLFFTGVAFYYADSKITDVMTARELSISNEFSDMVSKMALLINAGMITREAWDEIANTGSGVLYDEMKTASLDMQNGVSEIDAYLNFSNRCNVPYVKKFISMLVQNLAKGNKELVTFLRAETTLAWEEKKHIVRRQGEAANNKLMIPLGMIMIGIFIMILVPIVSKIGL